MLQKIAGCFLVLLVCFGCDKKQHIEGYTRDDNGFYFKLLSIGDGNEKPQLDNVVVFDAEMKTLSDSIFWDTKHDAANGLFVALNSNLLAGSCNHYFLNMVEGDSASLLVNPSVFFRNYFDTIVPNFCKRDSLVKLNVKLTQIISKQEYEALKNISQACDM